MASTVSTYGSLTLTPTNKGCILKSSLDLQNILGILEGRYTDNNKDSSWQSLRHVRQSTFCKIFLHRALNASSIFSPFKAEHSKWSKSKCKIIFLLFYIFLYCIILYLILFSWENFAASFKLIVLLSFKSHLFPIKQIEQFDFAAFFASVSHEITWLKLSTLFF